MARNIAVELAQYVQRREVAQAERLKGYAKNWRYYGGNHEQSLPVVKGNDDNVVLNYARYIVDVGVAFLFGKDVRFSLKDAKGGESPAGLALDEVWRRNKKMTLLNQVGITGGVCGQAFVKIAPDLDTGEVRLLNVLPEFMEVFYDEDDIDDVHLWRLEYVALNDKGDAVVRRQDTRREGNVWLVEHFTAQGGEVWKPDPERDDYVWQYPYPPYLTCQNLMLPGSFYGDSDLEGLEHQDAVNFAVSSIRHTQRYHGFPKTIGTGFGKQDITMTTDKMTLLRNPDAKVFNLEMQGDISASMEWAKWLAATYLGVNRVPFIDPADVSMGALSGFALKILFGRLLEKTEQKRRTYGDMLVELNRRVLDLLGHGPDNEVEVMWQTALPEDVQQAIQTDTFELDYELVSKQTVQERRGIDVEEEVERIANQKMTTDDFGERLLAGFYGGQEEEEQGG